MMKQLILICLLVTGAGCLYAQQPSNNPLQQEVKPTRQTVTHKVAIRHYCCAFCNYVSQKPGTCPNHQKALIREGLYYCEDGSVSREPGKCKDGKEMQKMIDRSGKPREEKKAKSVK